jgi:hypothetical protein
VIASAHTRRGSDPGKQIPLRIQDRPAAAGTTKPVTEPAAAITAASIKNGAKRARRLRPLDRARKAEYAAKHRKIAAFVAVGRGIERSGSIVTVATSMASAAAKITEAAMGEILRFIEFLDSWFCK